MKSVSTQVFTVHDFRKLILLENYASYVEKRGMDIEMTRQGRHSYPGKSFHGQSNLKIILSNL